MDSAVDTRLTAGGFPHSDIPGSKVVCHLPEAYRRLPRLSSPLTAKASTMCTSLLDYTTPNSPITLQVGVMFLCLASALACGTVFYGYQERLIQCIPSLRLTHSRRQTVLSLLQTQFANLLYSTCGVVRSQRVHLSICHQRVTPISDLQ